VGGAFGRPGKGLRGLLPGGAEPASWSAPEPIPEACRSGNPTRTLRRTAKVADVVDLIPQAVAADGTLPGTLKDQDGRLLRGPRAQMPEATRAGYEIRSHRPLFDYIVDPSSALYSGLPLLQRTRAGQGAGDRLPGGKPADQGNCESPTSRAVLRLTQIRDVLAQRCGGRVPVASPSRRGWTRRFGSSVGLTGLWV
jgi:hypothetical protein